METELDEKGKALVDSLYTLVWEDDEGQYAIGYLLDRVFQKLLETPPAIRGDMKVDAEKKIVRLFDRPSEPECTEAVRVLVDHWRAEGAFPVLAGWRNEIVPCFGRRGELLFSIERVAAGVFGLTYYGVHMTAYTRSSDSSFGMKIWVPRRAPNKSTYPGMLDNTVAGGLVTNELPFECIVREAEEEANLPEDFCRRNIKLVGDVTYHYIADERSGEPGLIYPERQWTYDLELPADMVPEPKDGEVDYFALCTVDEVQRDMAVGLFKPNCALVLVDFFLRHGILTPDNEPCFDELKQRVHRKMPFPQPVGEEFAS